MEIRPVAGGAQVRELVCRDVFEREGRLHGDAQHFYVFEADFGLGAVRKTAEAGLIGHAPSLPSLPAPRGRGYSTPPSPG